MSAGRIAVAMSGGVDSATAAALLLEAGHDVVGITLRLWSGDTAMAAPGRCCSPADIADARAVAGELGFPHYVFDHGDAFRQQVVEPFLDDFAVGLTPSPCVRCNRNVKFGLLRDLAAGLGATELATGHYARLSTVGGRPRLRKAVDADKDQSYFLFHVRGRDLAGVRFPLGELTKEEVRSAARRLGLRIADKAESHDLCFIPDGDKDAFVARERPHEAALPVRVERRDGEPLATARGLHRFTVGQRRGLGASADRPLYVLDLDAADHRVVVGGADQLLSDRLTAESCNWLAIGAPRAPLRVRARIRHRHTEAAAWLAPLDEERCAVRFDAPQRAIAPGQGVAFYDDDLLLGGGWIARPDDARRADATLQPPVLA